MIEVHGLMKTLGENRVLEDVTFTAPSACITGLLGPNGAGKTTTMRVLSTLLRPDEGTVHIAGVDIVADPMAARRMIGLVTEEPGLHDRLSVREQLLFSARAHGMTTAQARDRIEMIAGYLNLESELDRRAGVLSKGNRQKVSLCRALVHDPPVLLLDEPTSGLDVVAADGLEALLEKDEITGGKTVLLSTHRLDEAERLAQRVVGIAAGRVVVDSSPDELVASSGADSFREAFIRVLGEATLGGAPG
jgi:ABC-type multidrug transport system ATPase subunit